MYPMHIIFAFIYYPNSNSVIILLDIIILIFFRT